MRVNDYRTRSMQMVAHHVVKKIKTDYVSNDC